jgi:hypothetical protein
MLHRTVFEGSEEAKRPYQDPEDWTVRRAFPPLSDVTGPLGDA